MPALIKRKSLGYVYINVIARFNVVEKASKAENLCVLKVEYCEKYLGQKELSSWNRHNSDFANAILHCYENLKHLIPESIVNKEKVKLLCGLRVEGRR